MVYENEWPVQQKAGDSVAGVSKSLAASSSVAELRSVEREFASGGGTSHYALKGVSLKFERGICIALVGSSGSGKSTLLNLVAGLDRPTSGHVVVAGLDLGAQSEDELSRHRGKNVGVVFQFFQLLPSLTALENVLLPMQLVGRVPVSERRERAFWLLEQVSIVDQANKLPMTLSGGQQQRVAIARALANDPLLLVADEPTGNLDGRTAEQVLELLTRLTRYNVTVVMATHETRFLPCFHRVVTLQDGHVVEDRWNESVEVASLRGVGAC